MLKTMLEKGKCFLGFHAGDWRYQDEEECTQVQVCERCRAKNKRIEHAWKQWRFIAPNRCDQMRACGRCAEKEHNILHEWGEPEFISASACDQRQICARCREQQQLGVAHDWAEWVYLRADDCEQTQTCSRCGDLGENTRQVHRWGAWRYSEKHHEAEHDCHVCGTSGARSEFILLDEAAYSARILSAPSTGVASTPSSAAANSRFRDDATFLEQRESPDTDSELAFWVGKLEEEVKKEKKSGRISEMREDTLNQVLQAFQEGAGNYPADVAEQIAARGKMDRLMEQMKHVITSDETALLNTGSRASQVLALLNDLDRYIITTATRTHNKPSEFDEIFNLKRRLGWARTGLTNAGNDVAVYKYERENLRRLALDIRTFAQRHHLTLARPIWGNIAATANPDAIFYAGSEEVYKLAAQACQYRQLTLLPRTGPGDRARFRYQLLQECHVAVFDLSGYDRAQELKGAETRAPVGYESGIAFALGKPVVIIGKEGLDLPFDVDLEPILLQHNSADLEQLTGALDRALYGLQRGGSGESVAATAAYVRELAVGHNDPKVDAILKMLSADTLKDALKTRDIVADVLSNGSLHEYTLIFPAWAGAYPQAKEPRCFHVTGFRPWTKAVGEEIRQACRRQGVEYIRGDEALTPDIIRAIWSEIGRASHIIVDLSALNLNAVMELGMAHALGRNVLILGQEISGLQPTFPNISKQRIHRYAPDQMAPLCTTLDRFLATAA